ncbi:isochorismatase family protein [Sinomonas mesophila]|uniref:isochorismatase family protein n=1 Tax=Sinomonas mesophila TaxID=1531955 RepID=UPI00098493BB|nr:isochorismatase family protein [Sinomonas mesophila]
MLDLDAVHARRRAGLRVPRHRAGAAAPRTRRRRPAQLVKHRDSAFAGTDLLQRLQTWGADAVLLAGVSTHLCLAQTAVDAYAYNLRAAFADEAMGADVPESADAMLAVVLEEYRQEKLTQPAAIARLRGS